MIDIKKYSPTKVKEIQKVFFESSEKKDFVSLIERDQFMHKYLGLYYEMFPDYFYIAEWEGNVVGYICGAPVTMTPYLLKKQPHLIQFKEESIHFPAHLHINLTEKARGKGLGVELIERFCNELRNLNISGVHIITSPNARNIHFYKKVGFSFVKENFNKNLLFMGKEL